MLQLSSYSCARAMLRYSPPAGEGAAGRDVLRLPTDAQTCSGPEKASAGAGGTAGGSGGGTGTTGGMSEDCVLVTWEAASQTGAGEQCDGPPASQLLDQPSCRLRPAQSRTAGGGGGRTAGGTALAAASLVSLQELADGGSEALLLDALLICGGPQRQLAAAVRRLPHGAAALSPLLPPYRQRLVCPAAAGRTVAIDCVFMAVGHTWLHVTLLQHRRVVPAPVQAAGQLSSGEPGLPETTARLLAIVRGSLTSLGDSNVHFWDGAPAGVSAGASALASGGISGSGGGLWALVRNQVLADAVVGAVQMLRAGG